MNLLVKSPVWDDLREIGLHIAAENPGAADRFLTAARESFELLSWNSWLEGPLMKLGHDRQLP